VSSGIGLALAKKLIHLHKGLIYVTSKEGEGSVFTIKIPIGKEHFVASEIVLDDRAEHILPTEPNPALLEDEHEVNGTKRKGLKTILIVEDDPEIREFLKGYFEGRCRILEAFNGKDAIGIATNANPDLIISDVMMPEMNGIDFCKHIKQTIKTSHIPVILLTAKTAFTHHKEGLEIGADAYITKPFSPDMLGLTVDNLLQSHENVMRFYRSRFIQNGHEQKEVASIDEKFLQKVYDFVKLNLANTDMSLEVVCEELTISKSLLYKKIKSLTGLSPVEYLRSLRLAEAANLLKTGNYKVYEVVYMVGFTDVKYFRQCFQKEFGFSPSSLLEKQE
jgi:YesN/AraC family two-component response regulator